MSKARYVHTNLIARDWRALARFYTEVFGCEAVPPERDLSGEALDAGTGLSQARLVGAHLRLPGHGETGPTLELYAYTPELDARLQEVNRPGWGHIAFEVDDVDALRQEVLDAGGSPVGDVVRLTISDGRRVVWCYVRDPEGNVVELQSWKTA